MLFAVGVFAVELLFAIESVPLTDSLPFDTFIRLNFCAGQ